MHSLVLGELACDNLKKRHETLSMLTALPSAPVATHDEALDLIEIRKLMGRGLGFVDMHLLASALISGDVIWSRDRALAAAADDLKVCFHS
jgi:hypothetical protein